MAMTFGGWQHRASQFYFLIILFSIPMFSIPCEKGTCSCPIEVVATHFLANDADENLAKALIYPGSLFRKLESIVADNVPVSLPAWNTLLDDLSMTSENKINEDSFLARELILIGSYLCVIGALFAIFGMMHVSACGMLIQLWYIYTRGGKDSDVFALPMFTLTILCSIGGSLNLEGLFKRQVGTSGKDKET